VDARKLIAQDADQPAWPLIRRLLGEVRRAEWRQVAAAFGLMLVSAAAVVAFAKLVEPALNLIFEDKNADYIVPIAIAVVVIAAVRALAGYGQGILMVKAGLAITRRLRLRMFAHLMRADLAFFQNIPTGNLISRVQGDINELRSGLIGIVAAVVRDTITAIGLVGLMVYQDWVLSIIAAIGFPVCAYATLRIGRRVRKLALRRRVLAARLTTIFDETFRSARQVKAYRLEDSELERAHAMTGQIVRTDFERALVAGIAGPIIHTVAGVLIGVIIVYGGYLVVASDMTVGGFSSFLVAIGLVYDPIRRLSQTNAKLQAALAAAQRVFTVLDLEPAITSRPDAPDLEIANGEITFDRVTFSYGGEQHALSDLSLIVPAGKTIALVGPSGAGKSTVMNLIPRFYDPAEGSVLIDGDDVRDVTIESLRSAIALVSQEVTLFDDTIRANILCGRPDADDEAITAAAKAARAHDFITEFPDGYETAVGGRGEKLSGGQRQRITIARAMLKNAPILLLDEATSSLDTETEREVQAALTNLMKDRTTVIIAHRLSTVVRADLIYFLDRGRIAESGTHHQLLARGGLYARLYAMQAADDDQDVTIEDRLAQA